MEPRIHPLPADRTVPQPSRVRSVRRDGRDRPPAFHVDVEPKDEEPSAAGEHAPPPASHEDGTGARLDVTA